MSRILCIALLVLTGPLVATDAHAQAPGIQLGGATPQGDTAFVVANTDTQRFFAVHDAKGPSLTAGEAVTVIVRAEGRVRILVRGQFGWVPKAALSATPPPAPVAPSPDQPPPG